MERSSLLPYPSIERHGLILDDDANVGARSAVHRSIPNAVSAQVLRNLGALLAHKSKKIAAANRRKGVVNITCTIPPVATIPFAGFVSRWQLPDRVLEYPALVTRELDAVHVLAL